MHFIFAKNSLIISRLYKLKNNNNKLNPTNLTVNFLLYPYMQHKHKKEKTEKVYLFFIIY